MLVVSDSVSTGENEDVSGKVLVEGLKGFKVQVASYSVLPDDREQMERELKRLADKVKIDLVVTTGGTGVGLRDVTPEATRAVIKRELDGVEEVLRSYGQERTAYSMLSRGVVGIRGRTVIMNLPGSRKGVEDGIAVLFPAIFHTFRMMRGEGHQENSRLKSQKSKKKPR